MLRVLRNLVLLKEVSPKALWLSSKTLCNFGCFRLFVFFTFSMKVNASLAVLRCVWHVSVEKRMKLFTSVIQGSFDSDSRESLVWLTIHDLFNWIRLFQLELRLWTEAEGEQTDRNLSVGSNCYFAVQQLRGNRRQLLLFRAFTTLQAFARAPRDDPRFRALCVTIKLAPAFTLLTYDFNTGDWGWRQEGLWFSIHSKFCWTPARCKRHDVRIQGRKSLKK